MFRLVQQWWNGLSDLCRICFVTGAAALLVALVGAILNPLIGNWFHSTGMAFIGLFYLVLGLTSWPPRGTSAIGAEPLVKLLDLKPPPSGGQSASPPPSRQVVA